ncbi:uncharacterized protein LOC121865207 [Homarus americanus]|uniref:uncharacterized protein LOC121865207 n=1 Tax=Homarus americanus TaxID=6706 RepID=UPI001C43E8B3|nr:uncharacterized protein LOC121865207 [Homarus americanus]
MWITSKVLVWLALVSTMCLNDADVSADQDVQRGTDAVVDYTQRSINADVNDDQHNVEADVGDDQHNVEADVGDDQHNVDADVGDDQHNTDADVGDDQHNTDADVGGDQLGINAGKSSDQQSITSRTSNLDVSAFFHTPVASNLVTLITSAMRRRGEKQQLEEEEQQQQQEEEEEEEDDWYDDEVEEKGWFSDEGDTNVTTTTEENTSKNITSLLSQFIPASAAQFGSLGTGSKLVDLLPDMSEYSIDATGLTSWAGAGAVALMALGAILAVPVAPIILRRTGTSGWGGIPSLSNLLSWWSSPDPAAEAWADNYYQGYENTQDYLTGAYSNDEQQYDASVSGSDAGGYYADKAPPPAYHNTIPPNFHNTNPPNNNYYPVQRPPSRRQGYNNRKTSDGYEYVTLEEINRIGDESVRVLSELVQGHSIDDIYAYRDGSNKLNRRRLPAQQQYQYPQQYQPEPSYQQAKQHFEESYVEENAQQHYEDNNPEGHPYRQTFSMVEGEDQAGEQNDPHPYRHKYSFATSASALGQSKDDQPRTNQQLHKVTEFPYEFHKED